MTMLLNLSEGCENSHPQCGHGSRWCENGYPQCRHGFPSLCVLCLFLAFVHECENGFTQCRYSYWVQIKFNMVLVWANAVIFCVNLWTFYLSFHSS